MFGLAPGRLLPLDAQPAEVLKDRRLMFRCGALAVDILDANEHAPARLRGQPRVETRAERVAEVKPAVRRWSEAEDGRAHGRLLSLAAPANKAHAQDQHKRGCGSGA